MKLFFDARYIRTDFHDGISRFSMELGNAIASLTDVTFIISDPAQLMKLPKNANHLLVHAPDSAKEPFTAYILNRYKPDVVYSPMQTIGSLGRKFKLIVTVHDLIYYRHRTPPQQYSTLLKVGWRLYHATYAIERQVLKGVDVVATVSHTAKQDILKARLTKKPIVVVPNAPEALSHYLKRPVSLKGSPRNIVYMGSFMPYKNVETLVRAMDSLPEHRLHLLSRIKEGRKDELLKLTQRPENITFHNGVSDKQYAQLLADKAVLASASLDEGYGLPVAEALALGIPVVVSDIPIFHEVAGKGGLFFDPKSPAEFADMVKKLDDKALRTSLNKNGTRHISQYDWRKSAQTLLETIENTLLQ
ncbi:MAG: mannosyltransferase [Candidatus Saccharibacteria bacterium]|nr:mannosyltransferase [Candidatus Saccharibacteria bacterium]